MSIAPQMPIKSNPYYLIKPVSSYSMWPDIKLFKLDTAGIINWWLDRVRNFTERNLNPFQYFRTDNDTGSYACIIEREIWFARITVVHTYQNHIIWGCWCRFLLWYLSPRVYRFPSTLIMEFNWSRVGYRKILFRLMVQNLLKL